MKKIIAVVLSLAVVLCCAFAFASCGGKETETTTAADTTANDTTAADDTTAAAESDLAYIKDKGTLVVGITDFAPMDYKNEAGEWIGFDADMAKAFAAKLGVTVEFVEINWDNKAFELSGKNIDCVWNGMTLTDEVLTAMSCSNAYCNNAQVVVVPADKADNYKTVEACKDLQFAVEAGSAGENQATENGFTKVTPVLDQATAVQEVAAGTADAAIIDSLMAAATVGEGTGFEALTYTVSLNSEEYGVGFRIGSDVTAEFNAFFAAGMADGSVETIAETYGVQAALIK